MSDKSQAQEFYDQFEVISGEIDDITQLCEKLQNTLTRASVVRNGEIYHIQNKTDEFLSGKSCQAIDQAVAQSAQLDFSLLRQIDVIDIGISQLSGSLIRQKDQFAELWNAHAQELTKVRADLSVQKTKAAGLEARLREHALNNPVVRDMVWNITGGRCFYCEIELTRERCAEEPNRCFHIDHLVAKSNGGPDHTSNYVPACHRCNVSKGAKSFIEFTSWLKAQREPDLKVVGGTDV